jgi:general secretion pathway protein J
MVSVLVTNQQGRFTACCRHRPADATAPNAGFTLLEALIATLIMAIIMGALATVTAQWLPSWDRGVAALQRVEHFAVSLDRLTTDLAAAEIVSAGSGLPLFDGTELSVIFVRSTLAPDRSTGLEVVRIAATSDDSGPVLVRSTAPFVPTIDDATELSFSNPVVLIRGPYRMLFSYAGADRVWRDNWRRSAQLPRAIRVRVQDAATPTTLTMSTATLVHAELSAHCATSLMQLARVERGLGKNEGANATLLQECLGPGASSGG